MDTSFPTALASHETSPKDLSHGHPQTSFAFQGQADAVAFLVNGQDYFAALAKTLRQARNSILVVGWDFNPDILLQPGLSSESLGDLLQAAVRSNPDLEVRILVWAMGPIYSQKSLRLFFRRDFPAHPRIRMAGPSVARVDPHGLPVRMARASSPVNALIWTALAHPAPGRPRPG